MVREVGEQYKNCDPTRTHTVFYGPGNPTTNQIRPYGKR
jgi:hypothetical protein